MKYKTLEPVPDSEFTPVRNIQEETISEHRVFKTMSPATEFVLLIIIFFSLMGVLTFFLNNLVVFIWDEISAHSIPLIGPEVSDAPSMYFYFLLFA